MEQRKIQAVLFDMDGLMFDTEKIYMDAWKRTGELLNIPIGDEFLIPSRGMIRADSRQFFEQLYHPDMSYEEIINVRQQFVEKEFEKGVECKTGLKELLIYLKKERYAIALATSTPRERAIKLLQQTKTEEYFDALVCGDMVQKGKPEPDIFLRAAKEVKKEPVHCLVLEDSKNGIMAGKRAGCKVIMIPDLIPATKDIEEMVDARFDTLFQVIPWLQEES